MTERASGDELSEHVVHIRRVAKVVKGGRNLRFNAMVVVGDGQGRVGAGLGKGQAVPDAVRNGANVARKSMVSIPLNGSTVHHSVSTSFGASRVIIRPAAAGAGVIAGGAVRAVMEAAGVRDVVAKTHGSRNPINIVKAALQGLQQLQGEHSPLPDAVLGERASARREPASLRRGDGPPRGQQRRGGSGAPAPAPAPAAAVAQAQQPAAEAEQPAPAVDEPTPAPAEPAEADTLTEGGDG
ncbi:MAG: 30S ribosomal protein S5 [Dehalococcoidia bacterium]|nr:30S ribosomal protein S5 [Dehalococcoidia bacterium]